jgi:polyhydroxyalkanoate synthase
MALPKFSSPAAVPQPGTLLSEHDAKKFDAALHEQISAATLGLSPISLALACADWAMHLAVSPGRQTQLAQKAMQLVADELQKPMLQSAGVNGGKDEDARFADPAWSSWPFSMLKDSFKAGDSWWQEATRVDGMSTHRQQMVSFFARQWMDAMSPSNWPLTNPQVIAHGFETAGQSWLQGLQLFLKDYQQATLSAEPNPEQLAPLPYAVGKDVGVTPGKVVFRNHLIELIQYEPVTKKVAAEPLLIIPSPIMKFYILDLSPENSMVRYLVSQGLTVFMISWRNPDANDRDLCMDDYLQTGVMKAMREVSAIAKAPAVHAMGYCLGGTFLAIVAGLMGSDEFIAEEKKNEGAGESPIPALASVSLLAAQTDFTEAGELGIFIDDDQLKTLREQVEKIGYLSGRQMAGTFQFLHSKDLIWSRNTQRYLMGVDETGNDLMSWNADTTRLPQRMHAEYLDSLFLRDDLVQGHYKVAGMPVALRNLQMPLMVVGTVRDHVSPWRSVYKIHLYTDTDTSFILAAGGHNAGIVSEPGHPRRSYQSGRVKAGADWVEPDAWIASAPRHEGSWWELWSAWLQEQSSTQVDARVVDDRLALCAAPGEYVMVRYAD